MKRTILSLVLCISLFCSLFAGCAQEPTGPTQPEPAAPVESQPLPDVQPLSEEKGDYGLTAAVLYDGQSDSVAWQDLCDLLDQAVLIGLDVEAVDASQAYDLTGYDLVIPDGALAASDHMETLSPALVGFTEQGGYVLLDNAFANVLPREYLGISGTSELEGCPLNMTYPDQGADLAQIQEVIQDLAALYPEYYEAEALLQMDYGYGFTADKAQVLAEQDGQAIYIYHNYGKGGVMVTNPLLPNVYSLGNLSMIHRGEGETAFANTTASCNLLLYSRFAGFVAKENFGYALNRVYGNHGAPSMAWELHYEEITAYQNNAMKVFDEICREFQQIPSYTIIRNSYWWFLRTETVTYLLNQADSGYAFQMDWDESAYSSGTHIAADGEWLHLSSIEEGGSYFRDYPEHNYHPYPCFADFDGDGEDELLSGSVDGFLYLYDNLDYVNRLTADEAIRLTDEVGNPIQVSGFSAPQALDVNGDGCLDLLIGDQNGRITWYAGDDKGNYVNQGVLLSTDIPGQALPAVGDLNGDGVPDLAVGSDQGILLVYYGQEGENGLAFDWHQMESYSKTCTNEGLGKFLAPTVVDWDGDGRNDLAVGTFDGYIAILTDGQLHGFIDIDEMNYKGNHHVKFGNYAVPCFYDVDGDGALDLVCGSLEYGLAYPIDSEYFPYRAELQAQFDYAARNQQYIGVHHYSNAYASPEREAYELERHKEAFASYGYPVQGGGTNAHTWYQSVLGDTQTLDAEFDAGLLWNSGFSAPGDPGAAPQYAAENVIALPFFLQREGEDSILIQNNSVLPYASADWSDTSARYGMPMCVYYHCDFVYENDAGARDYVNKLRQFQWANGYNFMREDQLMMASAAARNLDVLVEQEGGALTITAGERSQSCTLYNETVQAAAGLEIQFAEGIDGSAYTTDAKVWYRKGNSLFLSLSGGKVTVSAEPRNASILRQVNLPADITITENGAEVTFLSGGMEQVVTHGKAQTNSVGWTVTEQNGNTVFTKYGGGDTLLLTTVKE